MNLPPGHPFSGLRRNGYGALLCDPPWRFETWSETRQHKAAARHYAVITFDDLLALPVYELAAPDCMLFMWGLQAMVPQALELMEAWEFAFKTMGVWAKQSSTGRKWAFGTGYVLRSAAEPYFVGVRGHPKSAVKDVRNLIVAPVREHSRKPDQMYADVERMFPDVARCEMFARGSARPGWDAWGLEAEPREAAE